jgi:tetratricopeptide (TPR) repeat protein|tara:strand:+ start:220 stop:681 length:462 start_codon:yes stop_codon:yes gene_type:complete
MNEEAVKLAGEGKAAEAVAVYDKAIAASAEDGAGLAVVLTNRAVVLITLDKLDEAIADCTRAVKRDPKYEGAYQAHSKALACAGKLQQALDLLRSASKEQAFTGLNAVIAQLAAEQALETAVAKKDPARQKMNEYLNWLKQRGVDSSRVKVRM